jgi:hypothetical protein
MTRTTSAAIAHQVVEAIGPRRKMAERHVAELAAAEGRLAEARSTLDEAQARLDAIDARPLLAAQVARREALAEVAAADAALEGLTAGHRAAFAKALTDAQRAAIETFRGELLAAFEAARQDADGLRPGNPKKLSAATDRLAALAAAIRNAPELALVEDPIAEIQKQRETLGLGD